MLKFRTYVQDPWSDWNTAFCREVAANTRRLAIWVPGLVRHDWTFDPDASSVRNWERVCRRIWSKPTPMAFAVLPFRHLPSKLSALRPSRRRAGLATAHEMARVSVRLAYMVRQITVASNVEILMSCEDFAARWAVDAGITPAVWLLEMPVIDYGQAVEDYAGPLSRPGVLRRSRIPRRRKSGWSSCRLPCDRKAMITNHIGPFGTYGFWATEWRDGHIHYVPQPITRVAADKTHTWFHNHTRNAKSTDQRVIHAPSGRCWGYPKKKG